MRVCGYTKANGTYVAPYYRSLPGTKSTVGSTGTPTLSSPLPTPVISEPVGTYLGWSALDPTWADTVLDSLFRSGATLTYGYSHRQTVPSSEAFLALLKSVLRDEHASDGTMFVRQISDRLDILVFRSQEPRALYLRADRAGPGRTVQVVGFTFDNSALNIEGYTDSSLDALLATLNSPIVAPAKSTLTPTVAKPQAAVSTTVAAPVQPSVGPSGLVLDNKSMFVDPESGNVVVAATCAPFKRTFTPATVFSRVGVELSSDSNVNYNVNVLVGDMLRYTAADFSHSGMQVSEDVLVGAQTAGTPVTLSFKNNYNYVDCQGTLTLTLNAH